MKKLKYVISVAVSLLILLSFVACEKDDNENPDPTPGNETIIDTRDGIEYRIVKIGNQYWMAENLAYLPSVASKMDQSHHDPFYYVYGYDGRDVGSAKATNMYTTYGVLYNWKAAQTACPAGWHLPSDDEWKQMEMAIGMSQEEADKLSWRNTSNEAAKLKAMSGWPTHPVNTNGSDIYGFTAIPSGYLTSSFAFVGEGLNTNFWTSTQATDVDFGGWYRNIAQSNSGINRATMYKQFGFSVRCVRN